jgi:hypothetical protein
LSNSTAQNFNVVALYAHLDEVCTSTASTILCSTFLHTLHNLQWQLNLTPATLLVVDSLTETQHQMQVLSIIEDDFQKQCEKIILALHCTEILYRTRP